MTLKAMIFKYKWNNVVYYAEGYDEAQMRACLEVKLGISAGTLLKGVAPDFNKELKRIWDKNDKDYFLTLRKEDTVSEVDLKKKKQERHTLYELELLLKEDPVFLGGVNDILIKDPANAVLMWAQGFISEKPSGKGFPMVYTFQGSTQSDMTDKTYRFRRISGAYWYVRNQLIEHQLGDLAYRGKKVEELTNLEMCDSFVAGFGNADIVGVDGGLLVRREHTSHLPLDLLK
jgi:hypothetical protein